MPVAVRAICGPAVIQLGDTFNVTAGTTFLYDSNVFRLVTYVDPFLFTGKNTKSDHIITTTATLNVNKHVFVAAFRG